MKPFLIVALFAALLGISATPEYSIQAIRYASIPDVPVSELVMGGPKDQKIEIAMVVWLIQGGGHTILFDSGFHRDTFLKDFPMKDYLRPDKAVETAGVKPAEVTDIVISHAHWDHMGGLDLFPKASGLIQTTSGS
jgi:glyoxylase-like metal-dependent hydrolase (beta-lactamase superfamily II)